MLFAARETDPHICPMTDWAKPHAGGPLKTAAVQVETGGPHQSRLADFADCVGPPDVIAQGAETVLVQQLPAARMTDKSVHGGFIAMGFPTVLIGGPTFTIPKNITIEGTPDFQNKVIRDLFFLSTLPSGKVLFKRLGDSGAPIVIKEYEGTDNSFCDDNTFNNGSTILYSPGVAIQAYDVNGNLIDMPPQIVLGHEMVHALGNAEGTHAKGKDPNAPASEPNIEAEEARTIGTGSYNGQTPTENSLRQDAGLPRRDNHLGQLLSTPAPSLRPGGY